MKKYQLIIFKFKYTDNFSCIWPIYFEPQLQNGYGQSEEDILERIISELKSHVGIKDVEVIFNKSADIEECQSTIKSILTAHPKDDEVRIKYLKLEAHTELRDEPLFDYENSSYYSRIEVTGFKIPIRVRALNFKFLLDDIELPIIVINN